MARRREFSRKVRGEIILRATNERGILVCEGCGLVIGRKPFEVDHTVPEELVTDKSKPLTADDGKLLGTDCCHKPKTKNDIRTIRKSDRVRDRDRGAFKPTKRPLPFGKKSPFKRKITGEVVPR